LSQNNFKSTIFQFTKLRHKLVLQAAAVSRLQSVKFCSSSEESLKQKVKTIASKLVF